MCLKDERVVVVGQVEEKWWVDRKEEQRRRGKVRAVKGEWCNEEGGDRIGNDQRERENEGKSRQRKADTVSQTQRNGEYTRKINMVTGTEVMVLS